MDLVDGKNDRVFFGMRFSDHGRRVVMGAFDGGEITSDAGGLLRREAAKRLNLFSRMATCFDDRRKQEQVTHLLPDLLAQRVIGIALGYEDLNDHDRLRDDPLLKVTATAKPGAPGGDPLPALAGSSTLGRLERRFEESNRRYHKITTHPARLQDLYVDLFTASYDSPPERIVLDIDATDIETHGQQVGGFFHGCFPGDHRAGFFQRRQPAVDQRRDLVRSLGAGEGGVGALAEGGVAFGLVEDQLGQLPGSESHEVFCRKGGLAGHDVVSRRFAGTMFHRT